MLTQLWTVLLVAWSVVSPDAAPVPPVPTPTYNLEPASPNYNETGRRYDICIGGNFQNIPTQLQIRFVTRQTEIEDETKWTEYANPECVQCSTRIVPVPTGQDPALTAYHRLITSIVRLALHDLQLDPRAGRPLMAGVDALAQLCHAADAKSRVAGAYVWANNKFGTPQAEGFMRDATKPEDGGFTGFASVPTYNPVKYRYTLKTEFWSGPVRLGTFKNPNGEVWTPVPR